MTQTSLSGARRPPGRATMRDVAAAVGVSVKTVSRVVNDESGVAPDVRERVREAVARLGYRHNLAASNLRRGTGRTGMVAALVQDVTNSYSAALLRSVEDAARDRGTAVLAASLDEAPDREQALVQDLATRRVDGLILVPATARQDYLAAELDAGMPVVFVDREPVGIEADSVTVDNRAGARLGTGHLLDNGHRRVAALADLDTIATAAARLQGFRDAHIARGLAVDDDLVVSGLHSSAQATEATLRLLSMTPPPTAIFAARNTVAAGAARAIAEAGRRGSVALVGFDDFPLADLIDPPLTVVSQQVSEIARAAVTRLFARIDGDTSPPHRIVYDCELITRGSGEIPPPD